MDYLNLRHTGAMTFGGQSDAAEAARIVHHCLAAGISFIDTAKVYNKGASEEILGRALKRHRR